MSIELGSPIEIRRGGFAGTVGRVIGIYREIGKSTVYVVSADADDVRNPPHPFVVSGDRKWRGNFFRNRLRVLAAGPKPESKP